MCSTSEREGPVDLHSYTQAKRSGELLEEEEDNATNSTNGCMEREK